jgi:flagellar motor protein MotB
VSTTVGDRTELVDTGRHAPKRRPGIGWTLLAVALASAGISSWVLWEQGRLARDEAADAQVRLADANQRAAAAESQILAMSAERHRAPGAHAADAELPVLAEAVRAAIDLSAGDVAVDDAAGRLVITLDDPEMFRGHDAELTQRGDKIIDAVATSLAQSAGDRALWVHGHVDDAPLPDDAPFENAWELSSARALAVVRRLAEGGIAGKRLAAVAFGAERPAGKDRAKNRRIEIVVEAETLPPPAAAAMRANARSR